MESSEELKLAEHRALQDFANHYDAINWRMHTIFVVIHVGLVGWLGASSKTILNGSVGDAFVVLLGSIVGWWLVNGWRYMFERHRLYTKAAYNRLKAIEGAMSRKRLAQIDFKVHLLTRPAINDSKQNKTAGHIATSTVIYKIQWWIKSAYLIAGIWSIFRLFALRYPEILDMPVAG